MAKPETTQKSESVTADPSSLGFNGGGGKTDDQQTKNSGKAINLYRFLQLKPQKSGITALLISKYKGEAKTFKEWEARVNSLLATKTK